jgi:5-methylcytosine-specific restriction protein A
LVRALYSAGRSISSCSGCGVTGSELEVHFLRPLATGGTEDPDNLILLCKSCHDKVHHGGAVTVRARIIAPRRGEG